jgi:hypothetical protein
VSKSNEFSEQLSETMAAMRQHNQKQLKAKLVAAAVTGVVTFALFGVALTLMITNDAPGWAYWTLVLALIRKP